MHEMSLAESIVQIAEDTARSNGGSRVSVVLLEVGKLAGVHVPLQAAEHYYLITEAVPGVTADLPVLVDSAGCGAAVAARDNRTQPSLARLKYVLSTP